MRNVSVGDFVQVGQKILLLEDLKRLKFDFKVPEKYINDIKEAINTASDFNRDGKILVTTSKA